jgi:hypothetical protein
LFDRRDSEELDEEQYNLPEQVALTGLITDILKLKRPAKLQLTSSS